jgi:predicted PurR-regulated permease PerM
LGNLITELRGLATPETLRSLVSPEKSPLLAKGLAFVQSWAPVDPTEISATAFDIISRAGEALYRNTMQIIGSLPWAILQIFIFAAATWFFLLDGDAIMEEWKSITPLREQDDALIRREFAVVCRGVVWGTLLAGIVQGLLLMLILTTIAAVSSQVAMGSWIILLGLLTLIFAMIPFFGATAVWAPTAIWMILNGQVIEGLALIVLGALFISTSDNLVKIWVIKDAAKLHPLFVFICVFGGLKLLGILGVFVGPIIGAVLFAVVKVLRKESASLMAPVRGDQS